MKTDHLEMEDDSEVYKTLLESTKAIPWKIEWETLTFSYIGPQIESLLGWERNSWKSIDDWIERMHPDDREAVVNFCIAQSRDGQDHEADYRALTQDGSYVWLRDVVHVVRDEQGDTIALIGFMFDITERKSTEQRLLQLQQELEDLSYSDALTGIANRRMFNSILDMEWGHALRCRQPLSLIMLDIDCFKQYNDHYGHLKGDECLKQVAEILKSVVRRSNDFIARFGGEEFALILRDTDAETAGAMAERCREQVLLQHIPHAASDISEVLTISLGVSSTVPSPGDDMTGFIETVDKLLYQAKEQGRNRVEIQYGS
ncbi:sensor domain-containing diguanylate cyclase [Pontibacter sp. JAM-7]|uniref:sensor domain-containing diguanylate cyclase n=1 Tax=Pontibacter sp. JAM-7 TaxID=3366581 RepID=UPI003AF7FBFB